MNGVIQVPLKVLLVEDNPGDVDLVLDVLKSASPPVECSIASDGVEALRMLREQPRPQLILLDLNLPKKDGRQVLAEIKTDVRLRHIPVIVLSSSEAPSDLAEVYRLHANCFLTKPVDLEDYQRLVGAIQSFWLQLVKLPPAETM
jgi:chemotaxis family two-component system response regulator Rcp1